MRQIEATTQTEAVWREFHERLRAFISRRVRQSADVDDILQEVFVRIHRNLSALRQRDRLPAWIFQITRNAIADHFRSGARQTEAFSDDFDLAEPLTVGDEDLQRLHELSTCIEPMIAALPKTYREALVMTDLNGLTQREAAERSGLSFSGMKSRVQRARQQLKEVLLECCRIEFDCRGGIIDYAQRDAGKSSCGHCG
jgi:RNA polymerase sigma-70 factor (ECF subfamily)